MRPVWGAGSERQGPGEGEGGGEVRGRDGWMGDRGEGKREGRYRP